MFYETEMKKTLKLDLTYHAEIQQLWDFLCLQYQLKVMEIKLKKMWFLCTRDLQFTQQL